MDVEWGVAKTGVVVDNPIGVESEGVAKIGIVVGTSYG